MLCGDGLYTKTVVVQPPSQTDTGRPLLHRPLPPPPPKTPIRQTDERNELIYMIVHMKLSNTSRKKLSVIHII
jgi:hypothetical protein